MSSISRKAYTMTITAAFFGVSMAAVNAMPAQDAAAAPQQQAAVVQDPAQAPQPVAAPTPSAPEPGSFEALDVNLDGALTKDEVPADHHLSKKFKKADADKSGGLSKAEFEAAPAETAEMKK
jgi:PBP1b-binding outer membrane lipoprotein LpoB